MPSWDIHTKWCVELLGCSTETCSEVNDIVDRLLVHDLGVRKVSGITLKEVFLGSYRVQEKLDKVIDLAVVNYRLREDECARKAFYLHHALDILLNTLIPANKVFGNLRPLSELAVLATDVYIGKYVYSNVVELPYHDGFITNFSSIVAELKNLLTQNIERIVNSQEERQFIEDRAKAIEKEIEEECKILYYYTLLDPWKSGNPLWIYEHARKAVKDFFREGLLSVEALKAQYPFNKHPYPDDIIEKLLSCIAVKGELV